MPLLADILAASVSAVLLCAGVAKLAYPYTASAALGALFSTKKSFVIAVRVFAALEIFVAALNCSVFGCHTSTSRRRGSCNCDFVRDDWRRSAVA